MVHLLKLNWVSQTNDVNQDQSVATSLVTSVNPLESNQTNKIGLSSSIAHTKGTGKSIEQNVFSSSTATDQQNNPQSDQEFKSKTASGLLGLCQMYNSEYDLAQKSFERACSLDGLDVRNWLRLGCNALCRGDAGVKDAELASHRLEEIGETIRKDKSTVCTFNLLEDFVRGCQKYTKTKDLKIVIRYLKSNTSTADGGASGGGGENKRPSTVPTF